MSIDNFVSSMARNGGMSMSNGYDVEFDFTGKNGVELGVTEKFAEFGVTAFGPTDDGGTNPGGLINLFCEEAQLPSMQAATGQVNGRYLGEGPYNFAHTRLRSDFSLTWLCDANMTPYKFLVAWFEYIFSGRDTESIKSVSGQSLSALKGSTESRFTKPVSLQFPDEYRCNLRLSKTEKGPYSANSRASLTWFLEGVFPYSIDTVPLSYGPSQITRVSASFYYSAHSIVNNDIRQAQVLPQDVDPAVPLDQIRFQQLGDLSNVA